MGLLSACWLLAAFLAALTLYGSLRNADPIILGVEWFTVGEHSHAADLVLSDRSVLMLLVVSAVSLLVHVYSTAYMQHDDNLKKYFAMLGFFTFSMHGIALSDNLLILFVFWELVGFSSYMLIGHWVNKREAGRAASKAFIMNRVGDAGFLVGLMLIWATKGSFSISELVIPGTVSTWQTVASVCIFCGVVGKSAQFPLFTWLPDAMEGPTPVSALIHAATMVAAGVYVLVRLFPFFTGDALVVVALTGMITAITGALAALSQYDIKRILAYSTMSQLGLMVLAIGMGVPDAALLHLITHAFFKACLFLSAGMVIYTLHKGQPPHLHFDVQDIRNMGGLKNNMPMTCATFLFASASLAGVPFFSGFLSKEAVLTALLLHKGMFSWLMIAVILTVSFLTVLYTFRMVWFVFFGPQRTTRALEIREPPWLMRVPVMVLAACSLWLLVSWNPFDFRGWMFEAGEEPVNSVGVTLFSLAWVAIALVMSWRMFRKARFRTRPLLRNAFFVDKTYTLVSRRIIADSNHLATLIDRRVIDRAVHALTYLQVITAHVVGWFDKVFVDGTVNATARATGFGGKITRSFAGGNIQLYIFWSVFAVIIFIIWALD